MKTTAKKSLSILLAVIMMFSIFTIIPITASAAGNSVNSATNYSMEKTVTGHITDTNTEDYYRFTLSNSGKIKLNVIAYLGISNYYIYDSGNNTVWSKTFVHCDETTQVMTMNEEIHLTSGTYYFIVSRWSDWRGTFNGEYNFTMNFTSANESFRETQGGTNNNYSSASAISLNTTYNGQLALNDTIDYYKFTLTESKKINLNITAYLGISNYYIYDSGNNKVWSNTFVWANDTTNVMTLNQEISLSSGTYYFLVELWSDWRGTFTGNYNFKISTAVSPTSVSLNKSSITLGVGESYTLTKTVSPSNASTSYTWSSSNTSAATVNSSGKITAKAVGSAKITVKTSNGKSASCTVTVKKAPSKVSLNKTSITIGIGETYDLNSSVPSGCASYTTTYSSNKTSVATVKSAGGLVTGKSVGTATITAKTYNGKTATCKVTVKKAPTSVSLNKTSITIGVGETYDLNSSVPSGCASYTTTYSSNKTSVATVKSAGGLVTGKSVGTATITAKTYNGKTATCKVTVKKAPTSISLNKTSLTLKVGQTYDLNSYLPSGCASNSTKYTSSNTSVATVKAAGGLVTAKKKGTATITATTYNGKKATCKVTVK